LARYILASKVRGQLIKELSDGVWKLKLDNGHVTSLWSQNMRPLLFASIDDKIKALIMETCLVLDAVERGIGSMPHHVRLIGNWIYAKCRTEKTSAAESAKLKKDIWSLELGEVEALLTKRAQEQKEHKMIFVGGYILLRIVNPYICTLLGLKENRVCRKNLVLISKLIQYVSNKCTAEDKLVPNGCSFLLPVNERFHKYTQRIEWKIQSILAKFINCTQDEIQSVQSVLTEQQVKNLGICLSGASDTVSSELKKTINNAPTNREDAIKLAEAAIQVAEAAKLAELQSNPYKVGARVVAIKDYSTWKAERWQHFIVGNRGTITGVAENGERVTITWDAVETNPYFAKNGEQFVDETRTKSGRFRLLKPTECVAERAALPIMNVAAEKDAAIAQLS